jgi:transmembrane sensor
MEEASDWFVEFRVEEADAATRARFDRWLRQSPLHIQAYLEIGTTYVALPPHGADVAINVDELIERARASLSADVVPLRSRASVRRPRPPDRYRLLLAASLAGFVVAAGLLVRGVWRNTGVYATGIGEERSITLADGTTVDLNARSRIRVRYTSHARVVDLIEGQALFSDVKLPNDPFIVRSHGLVVRAIGTQFDINREVTGTVVTVLRGAVAVRPGSGAKDAADAGPAGSSGRAGGLFQPGSRVSVSMTSPAPGVSAPIVLGAGEQVTVGAGASLAPHRADLDAATAWRRHELIFDSSKLADVVEEFNRYNRHQLVIESPDLADYEISGVYSSTDPTSFVRFLRAQPGFFVIESAGETRIARR